MESASLESRAAGESEAAVPVDANVVYSFAGSRSPSHGSQILNTALAKAIEQYEDKETTKLVHNEYEVLTAGEDDSGLPGSAGRKPKNVDAEDEEYEFV